MSFIISIAVSILLAYVVYYCFENYSFKVGAVAQIIITFVQNMLENSGSNNVLGVLIVSVIFGLIGAGINYLIYSHSSSFIGYLLLSILISFVVTLVLTAVVAALFAGFALSAI